MGSKTTKATAEEVALDLAPKLWAVTVWAVLPYAGPIGGRPKEEMETLMLTAATRLGAMAQAGEHYAAFKRSGWVKAYRVLGAVPKGLEADGPHEPTEDEKDDLFRKEG